MTIEQIVEQRQAEMRALEDSSEDIKRYRLLGYQLDRLVEVMDMLRVEAEGVKTAKPKQTRRAFRRGSVVSAIERLLTQEQAWGLEIEDIAKQLGINQARVKRSVTSALNDVFAFDAMSGLYSLKSREAERVTQTSDGAWLFARSQ